MAAKSIEIIPHIVAEEIFVSLGFGSLMTNIARLKNQVTFRVFDESWIESTITPFPTNKAINMKAFSFLRIFILVFTILVTVGASNPIEERGLRQDLKSYLVTFTHPDTPDHIIDSAINAIIQAGGKVTHRFKKLIKGFSTDAPPEVVNTYSTTSEAQQWGIIVEEDSVVGIVGQD